MAHGRDIHQDTRPMDVSLSCRRRRRRHGRVLLQRTPRPAGSQALLPEGLERHGRPDRIVIDGSPTNHEAIISCDAEHRLRNRSRRALKPIRIRKSKYLNNRIEQDHRRIKRRTSRQRS
ncbi:transposase (fragment) [Mesorhizobium prunaredense]|uniref:Transposase n=2 Tax=Mesorhizobium TaxID=68287 RepID=A0A1R3V7I2_9HYPH